MAGDYSDRFALPLLHAGQAQKEIHHNEALTRIDMLLHISVASADLSAPPGAPTLGQCWIVGAGASGAWAGYAQHVASWTEGGWRFAAPVVGMTAWVGDRGHGMHYRAGGWSDVEARPDGYFVEGTQVLAERQPGIADPVGGSAPDVEARNAVTAILTMLRLHGLIENS